MILANLVSIETHYPGVWIVIPAFNEAAVIGEVVADVRSVFDHVVCVDDGSRDGTGEIARLAGAYLVRHPINLGQGAAIQTGVEFARRQPGAQIFATFDADGQHRVKDVAAMVERLTNDDVDIVIGTRFATRDGNRPPDVKGPPFLKRVVSGMSHANEFILLIAEIHWRVVEEPVEGLYTEYSKSKGQPLLNGVNIIFDGFLRGRILK